MHTGPSDCLFPVQNGTSAPAHPNLSYLCLRCEADATWTQMEQEALGALSGAGHG